MDTGMSGLADALVSVGLGSTIQKTPRRLEDLPKILTPSEVASLFRVNPKTVASWARKQGFPCIKTPGGHRRYRREDVWAQLHSEASR